MNTKNRHKSKVFTLIIIDRSSSMKAIRHSMVKGINMLIDSVKCIGQRNRSLQEHYMTLVLFGGNHIRILCDNIPVEKIHGITMREYLPYGTTPLYDAIGLSLCHTEIHLKDIRHTHVLAIIISDGSDNSSEDYSFCRLQNYINELQNKGWTFHIVLTYHDSIDIVPEIGTCNVIRFRCDALGVKEMVSYLQKTMSEHYDRLNSGNQLFGIKPKDK